MTSFKFNWNSKKQEFSLPVNLDRLETEKEKKSLVMLVKQFTLESGILRINDWVIGLLIVACFVTLSVLGSLTMSTYPRLAASLFYLAPFVSFGVIMYRTLRPSALKRVTKYTERNARKLAMHARNRGFSLVTHFGKVHPSDLALVKNIAGRCSGYEAIEGFLEFEHCSYKASACERYGEKAPLKLKQKKTSMSSTEKNNLISIIPPTEQTNKKESGLIFKPRHSPLISKKQPVRVKIDSPQLLETRSKPQEGERGGEGDDAKQAKPTRQSKKPTLPPIRSSIPSIALLPNLDTLNQPVQAEPDGFPLTPSRLKSARSHFKDQEA